MQRLRRSATPLSNRCCGLLRSWLSKPEPLKCLSDFSGLAAFSSSSAALARPIQRLPKSGFVREYNALANHVTKERLGANGILFLGGGHNTRECIVSLRSSFHLTDNHGLSIIYPCFARSFSSKASKKAGQDPSETRKDITTVEDPFDAPTYNIPEKPVTFTEGASYSLIILVGLGVAAAAAYGVFKELIFEPKEYKIFSKALKRVQDDSQVRVRIGTPIKGYGQESRNRSARQRIPNKIYTDEDGVEHVLVNFHVRGPHGAGKVNAEMFKDKVDKQWKYTYLIVEILQPSHSQLILESYMPAPAAVAT